MKIGIRTKRFHLSMMMISLFWAGGCGKQPHSGSGAKAPPEAAVSDSRISKDQGELLDIAFKTATAIPVYPHIKDRSRAQAEVVQAALTLDQPQRALGYIERIDNWRRGAGYADLAIYYATHQLEHKVRKYLDLAEMIAEEGVPHPDVPENLPQEWRRDHIRSKIAQTYAWLGMMSQAQAFEAGLEDAEIGKVTAVKASVDNETAFEKLIEEVDELAAQGRLEISHNALMAYKQLFSHFYDDAEKRQQAEDRIKSSWGQLPIFLRVNTLEQMAQIALEKHDSDKAIALEQEARRIIGDYHWDMEHYIPMSAKWIAVRARAGETASAHADANKLLDLFDTHKNEIVNIYRARALIPLAEAYQLLGDRHMTLLVYKKAVEEGLENPNSRPRAEDLAAICCSMAVAAVEPDAELWTRIRQIHKGLGQPW